MPDLTHIGPDGRARMVDVTAKADTERSATATGRIRMKPETLQHALSGSSRKGNPLGIAELAGIMGAKRTADLVPLCHPLALTSVQVEVSPTADDAGLQVKATVRTTGKTGVEMESLVAVMTACLTLYDMLKAVDRTMMIEGVELIEKTGGASGHFNSASE